MATLFAAVATPGRGQLLSPGALAAPHAELEGVRSCTQCHQLGTRGVSAERCLACHTPLADRIRAGEGYHATVSADTCAGCHQDHLGRDFEMVRLDPASFAHDDTGWALEGRHAGTACRACHAPAWIGDPGVRARKAAHGALERTFLGLDARCASCHGSDDPHGAAFGPRGCDVCHDAAGWDTSLPYDHRETDFPLSGGHRSVACADCHAGPPGEARSIAPGGGPLEGAACADCHADPHGPAMSSACEGCHGTSGWHDLRAGALGTGFDHARTGFALRGAHEAADCAACHRSGGPPRSDRIHMTYRRGTESNGYPAPLAQGCSSCHVDRHVFPDGAGRWLTCSSCHSEGAWTPSSFGIAEHASDSRFPLEGAHAAVPCASCHRSAASGDPFPLALGDPACASCHTTDALHEASYSGLACTLCHTSDAFSPVDFDHPEEATVDCVLCHALDDPHAGQFADRPCSTCHGVVGFEVTTFDHATTRFPLDGAHGSVACRACHLPRPVADGAVVWYRPLPTACEDCHRGNA